MLEFTYYNTEKIDNLKDFFTVSFVLIDDVYNEIIPNSIKNRRNLYKVILEIQKYFSSLPMFKDDDVRIIDSMPIPVCKFGRAYFNKSFKDISTYSYCASKKETYFGLKLHALVTTNGFITDFLLTASNIDDRDAVFELVQANSFIKILAYKGYIGNQLKASLAKEKEILLLSLKRKNSKTSLEKQLRNAVSKTRRRVETSFSQLAEQFNINRVLAKTKWGLMLRITLKILAHNLSFVLNTITGNTIHVAQVKQLIFG